MKFIIKIFVKVALSIIILLAISFAMYGAFAFVSLENSYTKWNETARFSYLWLSVIVSGFLVAPMWVYWK